MALQQRWFNILYLSFLNLKAQPFSFELTWNSISTHLFESCSRPPKKDTHNFRLPNFDLTLISHQILRFLLIFVILMSSDRTFNFAFDSVYQIGLTYTAKKIQQKCWQQPFLEIIKFAKQMPELQDIFRKSVTSHSFLIGQQ